MISTSMTDAVSSSATKVLTKVYDGAYRALKESGIRGNEAKMNFIERYVRRHDYLHDEIKYGIGREGDIPFDHIERDLFLKDKANISEDEIPAVVPMKFTVPVQEGNFGRLN